MKLKDRGRFSVTNETINAWKNFPEEDPTQHLHLGEIENRFRIRSLSTPFVSDKVLFFISE